MAVIMSSCTSPKQPAPEPVKMSIDGTSVSNAVKLLAEKHTPTDSLRIHRGVSQVASLWRETDGTAADFEKFCTENFVAGGTPQEQLFRKLERNLEIFSGYFHKMDVLLKEPLQLDGPDPGPVDLMFGGYDPSAHLNDDFFANKIAFLTALNFPLYSLKEKTELGAGWSRLEWAYARMGDRFTSRVPADVIQNVSQTLTAADTYISDYNIYM